MNIKQLEEEMRKYKEENDRVIPSGMFIVAHLDGHNFSSLTREYFNPPFDDSFHDLMVRTAKNLMDCGFRVTYAYTQSDEISLLFAADENTFGRRVRKFNSILAGNASADFSLMFGQKAVFDCKLYSFPSEDFVEKYFMWRRKDAYRNALNMCSYWTLRKEGRTEKKATSMLMGKDSAFKKGLLLQRNINFDDLPIWQRYGAAFARGTIKKWGYDPIKDEKVLVERNAITEYPNPNTGIPFE